MDSVWLVELLAAARLAVVRLVLVRLAFLVLLLVLVRRLRLAAHFHVQVRQQLAGLAGIAVLVVQQPRQLGHLLADPLLDPGAPEIDGELSRSGRFFSR